MMASHCASLFVGVALIQVGLCQGKLSSVKGSGALSQGVRLVDGNGVSTNVGLLQVRTDDPQVAEFGTVCGMNLAAADVVCLQLGYDFGSVSTSPCDSYGGNDMCGASGSPVAMSSLACQGGELDIQDCLFSAPDTACLGHAHDSIVYCGLDAEGGGFEDGAARLLSFDGSPSIDGFGRLEVFHGGAWGPVCKSGFTSGAASLACKSMGFVGVRASDSFSTCRDVSGKNYCGIVAPRISEVACSGQETNLLACPFEDGDDVFCAPEESVVIQCSGVGDTQGRSRKVTAPSAGVAA